jgi:hypothetical protein
MKGILLYCFSLISLLTLIQCEKAAVDIVECGTSTPSYSSDIKPIMAKSCATKDCHDAITKDSGYDLSTYEATKDGATKKAFLGSIQHKSGYAKMPEDESKLSETEINKISCWVQNGFPK